MCLFLVTTWLCTLAHAYKCDLPARHPDPGENFRQGTCKSGPITITKQTHVLYSTFLYIFLPFYNFFKFIQHSNATFSIHTCLKGLPFKVDKVSVDDVHRVPREGGFEVLSLVEHNTIKLFSIHTKRTLPRDLDLKSIWHIHRLHSHVDSTEVMCSFMSLGAPIQMLSFRSIGWRPSWISGSNWCLNRYPCGRFTWRSVCVHV